MVQSLLYQLTILQVLHLVVLSRVHPPLGFADIVWELKKIYNQRYSISVLVNIVSYVLSVVLYVLSHNNECSVVNDIL